jgi:hypothetical protein
MPDAAVSSALTEHSAEFHRVAEAFVQMAERVRADGAFAGVPSSDLEHVLTAAIKLYAAKAEAEEQFPAPVTAEKITPTEIVLVVSELLRAADISLFDLAMWYRRGTRS